MRRRYGRIGPGMYAPLGPEAHEQEYNARMRGIRERLAEARERQDTSHTAFNCAPCNAIRCQLPYKESIRIVMGNDVHEMNPLAGCPGYFVEAIQGPEPVMCYRQSNGHIRRFRSEAGAQEWAGGELK